jgi:hypothetical protein
MVRGAAEGIGERVGHDRYLPSFTEEIAYMTTKKASSSVIRSA